MTNRLRKMKSGRAGYVLLAEVSGRWRADIVEVVLREEGIDVNLVQEPIHHFTHVTATSYVRIYVPKESRPMAREILKTFYNHEDDSKEN